MAISYGNPDSREFHFYREFLSFELKTYCLSETDTTEDKEEKTHYVYACVKNADADDVCAKYYDFAIEKLQAEADQERLYALQHGLGDSDEGEERKKPEKRKYRSKSE